jgi:REP element-mobilizing transposase RayT
LHHIICRGIERRNIFKDNTDRNRFLERLGSVLQKTSTPCYGWALIPNHFHLLLKTGKEPIAQIMRRLLTGYAVTFNRRHRRYGRLFQNRYKSILCQENTYLLELVRYIHLNPIRAGIVKDLKSLDRYAYTGHSIIMGKRKNPWQDTDSVLQLFGKSQYAARKKYRDFVEKGIGRGRNPEMTGLRDGLAGRTLVYKLAACLNYDVWLASHANQDKNRCARCTSSYIAANGNHINFHRNAQAFVMYICYIPRTHTIHKKVIISVKYLYFLQ